jgi:hypothetical protein
MKLVNTVIFFLQVVTSIRTEELLNALYPLPEKRPVTQVSFFSLGPIRGPSSQSRNAIKERDEEVARDGSSPIHYTNYAKGA